MTEIYFRTDGNSEIATGHLMRCLAIARTCTRKGASVTFVVSDEESRSLLEERFTVSQEFPVICLYRSYRDLDGEVPALLSRLSADRSSANDPDAAPASCIQDRPWLFIDSYYATASYFQALRPCFRTAYLDDLKSFDCAVDLVVNYDTSEDCSWYDNASRKLLGIQYTPLRKQFHSPRYEVRQQVTNILLSTGGTDPYGVAESLLHHLYDTDTCHDCSITPLGQDNMHMPGASYQPQDMTSLQSMQYHILTSRANTRYTALTALAQAHPQIHIHTNVSDVAALMASCDLAVSAGGTTLCELCAVGVPSVSYLMAENQRTAVDTYARLELIPCAGDIRPTTVQALPSPDDITAHAATVPAACDLMSGELYTPNDDTLRHILAFLLHMAPNYAARAGVSSSMRSLHDGAGADRIATALLQE